MAEVVQETSPHTDAEWCIFFILPNLNPPVPSPFVSDYLCLCSATDPRLGKVADSPADNTARRMLAQYRNWFQKPYSPGCLLVRHDAPGPLIAADALRAFRNVCAISTITHTMALALASKGNGQWRPLYSDFFLFSSFVAGKNGWIQNLDGPVGGMDDDVEHFAGQCSSQIGLPDGFSLDVDPVLLKRLLLAWKENYLDQPPITHIGRVLENAGIPIVKTLASTAKIDAFSRRGRTPIVIVNTFKESPSHWIFDMAHELGHFVCHADKQTGSLDTEREADAFASAFLLPARAFSREFKSETFSWDHMFHLKARWKVSLAAMIVRAYGLGLLYAFMYRRALKYLSARKWRKREPEEPTAQEPELLEESLKSLYLELGEHPLQVCKRLHFRPSTFSELTGIEVPKPREEVVEFRRPA